MEETKKWYASKTIWASVATVIIGLLTAFNIELPEGISDQFAEVAVGIATAVAGVIAFIGRIKAEKKTSL